MQELTVKFEFKQPKKHKYTSIIILLNIRFTFYNIFTFFCFLHTKITTPFYSSQCSLSTVNKVDLFLINPFGEFYWLKVLVSSAVKSHPGHICFTTHDHFWSLFIGCLTTPVNRSSEIHWNTWYILRPF